jgi:amidase
VTDGQSRSSSWLKSRPLGGGLLHANQIKVNGVDDLIDLSAVELCRLLKARELSATEVVGACLERVDAVNGPINAVVTVDSEGAVAAARKFDALPRSMARGVLHGLPVAIKDLTDVAGMRTTLGSPIYRDRVPAKDAAYVARLRAAGAIIVGKTNTSEFGAGSQTFNPVFGGTRNPYDLSRAAGGSSGGAAAAVAARMVPFADGSDFGGSLRNPASFCNVVGFRPTATFVRRPDASDLWDPLSVVGPIARNVEDATLLLRGMVAPDARAALTPAGDDALVELEGLRVAWSPNLGDLPIERSVVSALEPNLLGLERHGCVIEKRHPPLAGADETFHVLRALAFVRDHLDDVMNHRELVKETVIWNVEEGLALDATRIARAQRQRSDVFRSFADFMAGFDVLALPACSVVPFPVDIEWPRSVDGQACDNYLDWMRVCTRVSVTAHPAISIPFGFTEDGLPVGLQLVGRYRSDERLLRIAAAVEAVSSASGRRPALNGSVLAHD